MMLVKTYMFSISETYSFQPIKVQFKFDGVVLKDMNGHALVLTNKLVSVSSDEQRHFDLI